jgi:hypothetical protein
MRNGVSYEVAKEAVKDLWIPAKYAEETWAENLQGEALGFLKTTQNVSSSPAGAPLASPALSQPALTQNSSVGLFSTPAPSQAGSLPPIPLTRATSESGQVGGSSSSPRPIASLPRVSHRSSQSIGTPSPLVPLDRVASGASQSSLAGSPLLRRDPSPPVPTDPEDASSPDVSEQSDDGSDRAETQARGIGKTGKLKPADRYAGEEPDDIVIEGADQVRNLFCYCSLAESGLLSVRPARTPSDHRVGSLLVVPGVESACGVASAVT